MQTGTWDEALGGAERRPATRARKPFALARAPVLLLAAATAASVFTAISSRSLALDLDVYGFLQAWPRGVLHTIAARLDDAARVALAVVITGALVAAPRRSREAAVAGARIVSGAFVCELLKTALERLRPSSLPGATTGNSLPSGHIMNTTLVAIAAWQLADALPRRAARAARALVVVAVGAQAVARVLHGSHWPSDVLPSVLLALLWMQIALPLWAVERRRVPLVVAAVASYALFLWIPAIRIHLPSARDRSRVPVAVWTGAAPEDRGAGVPRPWSATPPLSLRPGARPPRDP